jgi:hypothetical protein
MRTFGRDANPPEVLRATIAWDPGGSPSSANRPFASLRTTTRPASASPGAKIASRSRASTRTAATGWPVSPSRTVPSMRPPRARSIASGAPGATSFNVRAASPGDSTRTVRFARPVARKRKRPCASVRAVSGAEGVARKSLSRTTAAITSAFATGLRSGPRTTPSSTAGGAGVGRAFAAGGAVVSVVGGAGFGAP